MTPKQETQKRKWLSDNRGALSRLAIQLGLSVQYVSEVYWAKKRSAGGRVETALSVINAPGFNIATDQQPTHYADLGISTVPPLT